MKKVLSLLLVLVMALSMFAACNKENPDEPVGTTGTQADADLTIAKDGATQFRIVYNPKEYDTVTNLKSRINSLINAIQTRTGAEIEAVSSWTVTDKTAESFDILIGDTGFAESDAAMADLLQKDYSITRSGNKVVIVAGYADALPNAINAFTSKVVNEQTKEDGQTTVVFGTAHQIIYRYSYKGADVKINGTPIADYTIVYPKNYTAAEYEAANMLAQYITNFCGSTPDVRTDEETYDHEIRMGNTARSAAVTLGKAEYSVTVDTNGNLQVSAGSLAAFYETPEVITNQFISVNKDITDLSGDITAALEKIQDSMLKDPGDVRMVFHNVYGNETPDKVTMTNLDLRCRLMPYLYSEYGADFVCMQEYTTTARNKGFSANMAALGFAEVPSYVGKVQVGKYNSASGYPKTIDVTTNTPIFYNAEKWELLKSGHYVYTTDKNDNQRYTSCSKLLTWGIFKNKTTGKTVAIISTHFDHQDTAEANARRLSECKELLNVANNTILTGEYANIPLIMGGDLNTCVDREVGKYNTTGAMQELAKAGLINVQHTLEGAEQTSSYGGYPDFDKSLGYFTKLSGIKGDKNDSIDHCYYKGDVTPTSFDIMNSQGALRTSDHLALVVDFKFN